MARTQGNVSTFRVSEFPVYCIFRALPVTPLAWGGRSARALGRQGLWEAGGGRTGQAPVWGGQLGEQQARGSSEVTGAAGQRKLQMQSLCGLPAPWPGPGPTVCAIV